MAKAGDKEVIKLEELVEEEEEVSVVIEQPEKEGRDGEEGSSYSGTTVGYGFLVELVDEEKDEELEKRYKENCKKGKDNFENEGT